MADEAENEEPVAEEEPVEGEEAKAAGGGGKKKLIIIIAGVVVALAGGGGAAMFMLGGDDSETKSTAGTESGEEAKSTEEELADENKDGAEGEGGEEGAEGEEAAAADAAEDDEEEGDVTFGETYNFKAFNLNLGNPLENHYIRFEMSVEYRGGDEQKTEIEKRLPQLRDVVISVTSRKTREFLLGPHGKDQLRREVLIGLNRYMKKPLEAVYLTDILIE